MLREGSGVISERPGTSLLPKGLQGGSGNPFNEDPPMAVEEEAGGVEEEVGGVVCTRLSYIRSDIPKS